MKKRSKEDRLQRARRRVAMFRRETQLQPQDPKPDQVRRWQQRNKSHADELSRLRRVVCTQPSTITCDGEEA
jgi:hypothetical protein